MCYENISSDPRNNKYAEVKGSTVLSSSKNISMLNKTSWGDIIILYYYIILNIHAISTAENGFHI